uniref:HAT C-terminal dimerisation domain-containing protein n=1 Tax=Acrobeloides nanus TaxID=290746 RepID=A0A914D4A2_9BILA
MNAIKKEFLDDSVYLEYWIMFIEQRDVYKCYLDILEPVNHTIQVFESETNPTFNIIALRYYSLLNYFEGLCSSENMVMKTLAQSGKKILEFQISLNSTVNELHFIAVLCDPLSKDSANQIRKFWIGPNEAKELFTQHVKRVNPPDVPIPKDPYELAPSSPYEEVCSQLDIIDVEINQYLKRRSYVEAMNYNNALDFWRNEEKNFSHIAVLARRLLCVVSSAASERIGSQLSQQLTKQRSNMKPDTISNLIYMKNLKIFEQVLNL